MKQQAGSYDAIKAFWRWWFSLPREERDKIMKGMTAIVVHPRGLDPANLPLREDKP